MTSEPPDPTRCGPHPRSRPRDQAHGRPRAGEDHDPGHRTAQALERLRSMLVSMEDQLGAYIDDLGAEQASPSREPSHSPRRPSGSPGRPSPADPFRPAPPATDAITVVVADGSDRFRRGLVAALDERPGVHVVGEAADRSATLDLVRRLHPQVVLCDLRLPGGDGIELVREIARAPQLIGVRIAVLAGAGDELSTLRARTAGANTAIDRASTRDAICDAVEALAIG